MHTDTHPLWGEPRVYTAISPLAENLDVDVCVVGAGVAGLSVARELVQQGRTVAVIDAGAVGGGETRRSTAHLVAIPTKVAAE